MVSPVPVRPTFSLKRRIGLRPGKPEEMLGLKNPQSLLLRADRVIE